MMHHDTIALLEECNSGIKMGVRSIEEVLDSVQSPKMRKSLYDCKQAHAKLGADTRKALERYHVDDKEPSPMAKSMSWMTTHIKLAADRSDQTIAEIMSNGCHTGIQSLYHLLNQHSSAKDDVKDIAKRLINLEEKLETDLREFL